METVLIHVTEHDGTYRVILRRRGECGAWPPAAMATTSIPRDQLAAAAPAVLQGDDVCARIREHVRSTRQSEEFRTIGEYLAGLLLRGEVHDCWENLRLAHEGNGGLRTLLQIEPDELRLLPWELMNLRRTLFVDSRLPFARVRRLDPDARTDPLPIRLLVVEGKREKSLGTEAELRAIKLALSGCRGRIDAEFLTAPSEPELRATYGRFHPHIFHFVGHGVQDPVTKKPALRVHDGDAGTTWSLTPQHFFDLLKPAPRLAVLNACRSSAGATDVAADVDDLSEALFEEGAAAVVGMQGDVQGGAAAIFGGALYEALVREETIDRAVTHARREVYAKVGMTTQERDWFLPSLTLRVEPERVLPSACVLTSDDQSRIDQALTRRTAPFIDRVDERRKVVAGIDPDPGPPARLLVVTGDVEAGKTELVRWFRRRCAWRGLPVRYVDLGGGASIDFVEALWTIRDTANDIPSLGAHTIDAFRRFNYDLGFLAEGRFPVEPIGDVPLVEPPPTPRTLMAGPVGLVERLFQSFRTALDTLTMTTPLVLVLDHLGGLVPAGLEKNLYPHLIREIADGHVRNLRLLLVLSREQRRSLWPFEADEVGTRVDVDLIDPQRYPELFEDFVLALGCDMGEQFVALRDALAPFHTKGAWRWENLTRHSPVIMGARRS